MQWLHNSVANFTTRSLENMWASLVSVLLITTLSLAPGFCIMTSLTTSEGGGGHHNVIRVGVGLIINSIPVARYPHTTHYPHWWPRPTPLSLARHTVEVWKEEKRNAKRYSYPITIYSHSRSYHVNIAKMNLKDNTRFSFRHYILRWEGPPLQLGCPPASPVSTSNRKSGDRRNKQ